MDEIEMDRHKALQGWDRQSCAEWEAYLDEFLRDATAELDIEKANRIFTQEPPCTCYYVDVDVVENRYCEAHGGRNGISRF